MGVSLDNVHDWIRADDLPRAREGIRLLVQEGVPRPQALAVATAAARCRLPRLGARVLYRIVHPPPRETRTASDAEVAEYAHCLILSDAVDEGLGLLAAMKPEGFPRILLYRAAGLEAQWDHRGTIPLLRRYLDSGEPPRYDRLTAETRLASALVAENRTLPASCLLRELLRACGLAKHASLRARVLETSVQCLSAEHRWEQALRVLDGIEKSSLGRNGHRGDDLLLRKARAIVEVSRRRGEGASLAELRAVRAEAERREEWESARHCDLVEAVLLHEDALAAKLYVGTPYAAFRDRLLTHFGALDPARLGSCVWGAEPGSTGHEVELDLLHGTVRGKVGLLKPGSLLHRLLVALLGDFYRPVRLYTLHRRVHPELPFHPRQSPACLHDGLWRLRRWLSEQQLPLDIIGIDGTYVLRRSGRCRIRVSASELLGRFYATEIDLLRRHFTGRFSSGEARRVLGLPRCTVRRILQQAMEYRVLAREGHSRATRYSFAAGGLVGFK